MAQNRISALSDDKSQPMLRMAPLIDVIFLLLLFFLVAAKWRPAEESLPMKLASDTASSSPVILEPFAITIQPSENGCLIETSSQYFKISKDQIDIDIASTASAIEQLIANQSRYRSDPILLRFDNKVRWEYVAKIYNALYAASLENISFELTPE